MGIICTGQQKETPRSLTVINTFYRSKLLMLAIAAGDDVLKFQLHLIDLIKVISR